LLAARALATALAIFAGMTAGLFWELRHQPRPPWRLASLIDALPASLDHLPVVLRQEIGLFGAYFPAPKHVYLPWMVLF
jgi:hypothetical protein